MHLTRNGYHTIFENILCPKHIVMSDFVKIKTKKSHRLFARFKKVYLRPSKTSLMELLCENSLWFLPVKYFCEKSSAIDVWQGTKYTFGLTRKKTFCIKPTNYKIPRKPLSKNALAQTCSRLTRRIQE